MGRPKKNPNTPDARERIASSFWELLETHQLREITIGMITAKANCNRGTFYYHFQDMNELIYHVIEIELYGQNSVTELLFRLSTGTGDIDPSCLYRCRPPRLSLLIERGGMSLVLQNTITAVTNKWSAIMYPQGGSPNPQTLAIIEYGTGGILTILSEHKHEPNMDPAESTALISFMQKVAKASFVSICEAERIDPETFLHRLAASGQLQPSGRM